MAVPSDFQCWINEVPMKSMKTLYARILGIAFAVNAMMKDTGERLMIDPRRVYTAGFSGGGRVATSVALSLGDAIAGVVACGGGFPSSVTPSKTVTFALFATAGTDDFNYPEM